MTRVANKYGAINLSQGFPDFDPPKEITERLAEVSSKKIYKITSDYILQKMMILLMRQSRDCHILKIKLQMPNDDS